jgi:Arc/MetJ-type ribon-helix-helix transcriptional regulator
MIQQKVQLDEGELEFIETACALLNYRSKSAYMRAAIQEKIRSDRRRLREARRRQAMEAYCGHLDDAFASIEAEDFEER